MKLYDQLVDKEEKLSLVGLGYVGMPIAVAFARKINVIGFDDGNLISSNLDEQCLFLANTFKDIEQFINKQ